MASNEVKICINGSKEGTPREVGEGCCKKYGDTKCTHTSSEEQQHKHGTAQASEQGAEGGGGVLT